MRVLIVEDEKRLAANVARALKEDASSTVDLAYDGEQALIFSQENPYDLILLDLMLPKIDGLQVLRRIRARGNRTPVLILTARDDKESIIALLNHGADDYLTKPFDLGELLARSNALIRRSHGVASPVLTVADIVVNTADRTVHRGERSVALTAMEYRVLEHLATRPNAIISKNELLRYLYNDNWQKFSNVVEVYISGLRRKLQQENAPQPIQTIRGLGYKLKG